MSLSISPIVDDTGRVIGVATISRDDAAPLRRTETKWRAMLEAAPDAIVAVDTAGRITLVNAQTERLFGYHREELLGQLVEMLVPPQARSVHPKHRLRYLTEPKPRPMGAGIELSALRRDGTQFPAGLQISLSAIETDEGALFAAAIRDVSERVRFERQLREKKLPRRGQEVVQSMRPLAEQKGMVLTADLPAEECVAVADRRALGRSSSTWSTTPSSSRPRVRSTSR